MKKEIKKLLAYVMALSVIISVMLSDSMTVQAASITAVENDSMLLPFKITQRTNDEGQTVYQMQRDYYTGLIITLSDGETAILDGAGYNLTNNKTDYYSPALTVCGEGTLIVKNITMQGINAYLSREGTSAILVSDENCSLILSDTVTLTGGRAQEGLSGIPHRAGGCGVEFHGKDLTIAEGSKVSIQGADGLNAELKNDGFYQPISGQSALKFYGKNLQIEKKAQLVLHGGNGGSGYFDFGEFLPYIIADLQNDQPVNGSVGGNAIEFYSGNYTQDAEAVTQYIPGTGGEQGSAALSYDNGIIEAGQPGADGQAVYVNTEQKTAKSDLPVFQNRGYTLSGWYTDTAYQNEASDTIKKGTDLYAKWILNSYTVSFDSNGGSSVAAQSVNYNTAASKPADPSMTGYTFAGWFTDKDCTTAYDFSSKVTGDITLYAKWNINSYTVSFDSNSGSSVAAQSVNYNTAASKPADPSMTGYTFAGWFTDKNYTNVYDFNSKVTGNITLYAKWDKIPDQSSSDQTDTSQPSSGQTDTSQSSSDQTDTSQSSDTPKKYTVTLNATSILLQKGKSTTAVKATLTKGDSIAKWTSSNKKVAAVDKKGKITAKKTGTATITVRTKNGATASVKVKVQKGKVTTKKLTVTNVTDKKLTLKKGKTFTIKTSVTPITSPDKVSYTSSNKKIVTVDKKGKLKAVKKGTATITVKSGKKTVKFDVTVTK